ncbi:MAG: hypothetical protein GX442_21925 [Candidatus Riflebacteria bacterium]|nr:hypothetical protein [Candidatus Riflebacteria bacterium]
MNVHGFRTVARVAALGLLLLVPVAGTALETTFFRDKEGGFFRVTLTAEDLGGEVGDGLQAVSDAGNLFGIRAFHSREEQQTARANRYAPPSEEEKRLTLELQEMHENDVRNEGNLLRSTLAADREGKVRLEAAERGRLEARVAELDEASNRLAERRRPLEERLQRLQEARYHQEPVDTRAVPTWTVVGRFRDAGQARLRLTHPADGRMVKEITLDLPATPGGDAGLVDDWLEASDGFLARQGAATPGDSVFSYLRNQAPRRLGGDRPPRGPVRPVRRSGPGQSMDLYSLTTGALAIQESLQLDRMADDGRDEGKATRPIDRLTGPTIRSHPFQKMIGGRAPGILPHDGLVPVEFLACHFADINRQLALGDLMDQWGTSLLHSMQVSSHDARVKEKIQQQLCLPTTELTRLFGDQVIGDLTLCGSDPFVHEGTDLTVLLTLRNRALFEMQFAKNVAAARQADARVREEKLDYRGVPILAVTTPDRHVYSFSCVLGEVAAVSNSPRALELVIDTAQGRHHSLGAADDYRYLRTVFPVGDPAEDVFIYLSEAAIRKLVGPVWKVARQRRLQCVNSLRMIRNAQALWGAEHQPGTPDLEALRRGRFLEDAYLFCPDGGRYALDPDTAEPVCSAHGRMRYLVPILEMPPARVTEKEEKDYGEFVRQYNQYWSTFFDPIGLRVLVGSSVVQLETCILPLIESSAYNSLRALAGGDPVPLAFPEHPRTIGQLRVKLALNQLRQVYPDSPGAVDPWVRSTTLTAGELLDALGDGLSVNVLDAAPTFQLQLPDNAPVLPELLRNPFSLVAGSFFLSGLTYPTYAAIAVRQPAVVERFVAEALRGAQTENELWRMNHGRGFLDVVVRTYAVPTAGLVPVPVPPAPVPPPEGVAPDAPLAPALPAGPTIYTLDLELIVLRLHFFFAVHDGFLLVANRRDVLIDLLRPGVAKTAGTANLVFRLVPERFVEVAEACRLLWQERIRSACLNNLGSLWALYHLRGLLPAQWADQGLAVNGYAAVCPIQGVYGLDPVAGEVRCSVHGTAARPRQPLPYDPSLPLHAFFSSLKEIESSLQFTPEGVMTRLRLRR